mmetsp:Transcript_51931/g.155108  ORF Transcript_51931/g.155108 Transcript_51931/m.155108 type:complete len:543 (-) Transcript_51931:187-1815(-)
MGNAPGCSSCKSKAAEADAVGDEPPVQVQGDDEPVAGALAQEERPASLADEKKEWALRPGGNLTVMMFGMTGAGKSALGNLIAGFDAFDYGDDTVSVTNLDSVMRYAAEDDSLVLLDTIGLGDTEIDQAKVVASIRDVALSAPGGVDVLLFIMRNARITDDAIARLIYATEYLWGSQCLLNLYIVVTHASRYASNREEANAWIERQVEINWRFRHIYKIVGENPNRFIFIDNPDPKSGEPGAEERRGASREAIMRMFSLHPKDAIPPFTFRTMERAKELTAQQTAAQQDGRAVSSTGSGKSPRQRRSWQQKPSDDEMLPKPGLGEAINRKGGAAAGMKLALLKAKADKRLQSEANLEVMAATLRFNQRWQTQPNADAGAGDPSGSDPAKVPEGLRQACKRMASFIISKTFSRVASSKSNASASAAAPGRSEADTGGGAAEEAFESESWDIMLCEILARLRSALPGPPEDAFARLDTYGTGAIAPLEFTQFCKELVPGIRHQHVGGLWRRADLDCDGQLNKMEFCTLLARPPGAASPKRAPPF